jgi:hypothetical protein
MRHLKNVVLIGFIVGVASFIAPFIAVNYLLFAESVTDVALKFTLHLAPILFVIGMIVALAAYADYQNL